MKPQVVVKLDASWDVLRPQRPRPPGETPSKFVADIRQASCVRLPATGRTKLAHLLFKLHRPANQQVEALLLLRGPVDSFKAEVHLRELLREGLDRGNELPGARLGDTVLLFLKCLSQQSFRLGRVRTQGLHVSLQG